MNSLVFKYLILPLVLILISGFIFWYFDFEAWNDILAAQEVIARNKEILIQRQNLKDNLNKLVTQYQEKIKDVAKIDQIVTETPAISDLLVMLEALAGENSLIFQGVDFSLIKPVIGPAAAQTSELPSGLQIVQMNAKVKGSYANFLNYIKAIETNSRLMDIINVAFDVPSLKTGTAGASGTEFGVIINAYYH